MVVLGAGVMGGAIAQLLAYKGIRVRMKDVRHEAQSAPPVIAKPRSSATNDLPEPGGPYNIASVP